MKAATPAHVDTPLDTSARRETTADTLYAVINHPARQFHFQILPKTDYSALAQLPAGRSRSVNNLKSDHAP